MESDKIFAVMSDSDSESLTIVSSDKDKQISFTIFNV